MGLFTLVSQLRVEQEVRRLGVEVAKRCQNDVTSLAMQSRAGTSLPELRGYLRARGGLLIKRQTSLALRDLGITDLVWHLEVAVHGRCEVAIQTAIGDLVKRGRTQFQSRRAA